MTSREKEKNEDTTSSPALHLSTAVNLIFQGVKYIIIYMEDRKTCIAKSNATLESLITEIKNLRETLKNKNAEIEKLKK